MKIGADAVIIVYIVVVQVTIIVNVSLVSIVVVEVDRRASPANTKPKADLQQAPSILDNTFLKLQLQLIYYFTLSIKIRLFDLIIKQSNILNRQFVF